jgi:hypothetical protein
MAPFTIVPAGKEHDPEYYVPPYDKDVELPPNYFCRARNTKREKYCYARAGQGTDHLGQGRCRNHGGSTPIVHGRYSDVVRDSIAEQLEKLELETEKEQMDVLPEAQFLRAIARDVTERFTNFRDAIIAWNEAEAGDAKIEKRKPLLHKVPDMMDVAEVVKKIAEVVNMVHKQRSANAISLSDFYRLMGAMAEVVANQTEKKFKGRVPQHVVDEYVESVQEEWRKIKVKA